MGTFGTFLGKIGPSDTFFGAAASENFEKFRYFCDKSTDFAIVEDSIA